MKIQIRQFNHFEEGQVNTIVHGFCNHESYYIEETEDEQGRYLSVDECKCGAWRRHSKHDDQKWQDENLAELEQVNVTQRLVLR